MNYLEFGPQKRPLSVIMLGLLRLARLDSSAVDRLLDCARDLGINALDTADCYGGGQSERNLGEYFKRHPDARDYFFVQSKCGVRKEQGYNWFDLSYEHILEAVNASLSRLNTDHLDCLLLHRPDPLMEIEDLVRAFEALHRSGKVLAFGASNFTPPLLDLLQNVLGEGALTLCTNQVQLSLAHTFMLDSMFTANMDWGSALMREGGILEYHKRHNLPLQCWSPLQSGYFGGVFVGSDRYTELNTLLRSVAVEQESEPVAVALAWLLRYPLPVQVVPGTTSPEHLKALSSACEINLPKKLWYELYLAAGNKLP